MALPDTTTLTINGVAVTLSRTGLTLNEGEFSSDDGQVRLHISHTKGKRNRHLIKASQDSIVADPFVPAQNMPVGISAHFVIDGPRQGATALQLQKLSEGLSAWCTAANLAKVIGGQS